MAARLSSSSDYDGLLQKYDTWMFDCDGVLWQGNKLIDGVVDVLQLLRSRNKKLIFVTNNASLSRKSYKKKFDKLNIEAHVDEIFGSAYSAAVYISSVIKLPKEKKVFVIGMEGIEEELAEEGVQYCGGTDPAHNTLDPFDVSTFTPDTNVAAVLCGLDTRINYTKLSIAYQYLTRNPGCLFLSTNDDSTYPANGGTLPGAGALNAPLRYSTGKDPVTIGKPSRLMLDCIQAKQHFDPQRTIMIGDRLNTDILFGKTGLLSTLLVLTGITQESEITGPNASPIVPDYVIKSIGDLIAVNN